MLKPEKMNLGLDGKIANLPLINEPSCFKNAEKNVF
jgi:hypothetical protein